MSTDLWRRAQRRGCPPDKHHEIIHDAVDVDAFGPTARGDWPVAGTVGRPLRILSVGRLHWKKGYEYGLHAVRRLSDRGVHCDYRVIGDGEHRAAVAYTIHDLGLEEVVRLEGARPQDDVRAAVAWADVLLHCAVSEGFCVAALEAQASGLPVVCSDAGGLPENVAHGVTGIVVPRRDPAAAADALRTLAADGELRRVMGENGRRRVERHFSLDEQIRRFDRLYRSLVGDAPSAAPRTAAVDGQDERRLADVDEVREALAGVPAHAKVLVVSRGDEALVSFGRCEASHFPQDTSGRYAGYYPADSRDAIAQLEALRSSGAEYLVFPPSSLWWLDHYRELAGHLEATARFLPASRCRLVAL